LKPAPFEYCAPRSVMEAVSLLGKDSKALAGGQTLVPMLNFRQLRPRLIVDVNQLAELDYLHRSGPELRIGAITRQATLERSELVARDWPLLRQAVINAGHPATRSRGTVAGSVAHAAPYAELPVALAAMDASFELTSPDRSRTVPWRQFFRAGFATILQVNELLTSIVVPPLPDGAGTAFVEHAPTRGDFAVAGTAVVIVPGEYAAIAMLGAGPVPVRAIAGERALIAGASAIDAAALATRDVEDAYRRALLNELVRRALEQAMP
jgi:CO/xanthine dehydrogenase FAD-binding subunit